MHIYFQGGETPDHRKRLIDAGAKHISVSFLNLKRRIKKPTEWRIADNFPNDVNVLVDAGAFSAGKNDDWSEDDWRAYVDDYIEFVDANLDVIDIVCEFDSTVLGRQYIEDLRAEYWDEVSPKVFMPVWHEQYGGLTELTKLAQDYDRVAITNVSLDERRVMANRLNSLVQKHQLKLHGLAITKPDDIRAVRFDSVSSTSWVSPMRFGDTIVWDGARLRRYPVKYKEQARKRHKNLFTKHGFDAEAILNDDPSEVVRLSIWSWLQFEEAMNRRRRGAQDAVENEDDMSESEDDLVATWADDDDSPSAENAPPALATSPPEVRNTVSALPALPTEKPTLPVIGLKRVKALDDQGNPDGSQLVTASAGDSVRQCDNCYVAANCPAMEPGSACKFSFPVEIRTKEQLMASMQSVVEMQMQRIAFARYAEELEGGYIDPNVSNEMERYLKMLQTMRDISDNRDMLKIQVESRGNAGVLSRLFGEQNVPKPENAIDPERAEQIIEGEIIDG